MHYYKLPPISTLLLFKKLHEFVLPSLKYNVTKIEFTIWVDVPLDTPTPTPIPPIFVPTPDPILVELTTPRFVTIYALTKSSNLWTSKSYKLLYSLFGLK